MTDIIAFFTDNGEPKTGLTPTIKIREVDTGTLVVNSASMTEIGDGWYKYQFNDDETKHYAIVCDGGTGLTTAERYVYAGNELRKFNVDLELLKQMTTGRWKIVNNQMIFYEDDNTTEIMRFNLYNTDGQPSESDVTERRKV